MSTTSSARSGCSSRGSAAAGSGVGTVLVVGAASTSTFEGGEVWGWAGAGRWCRLNNNLLGRTGVWGWRAPERLETHTRRVWASGLTVRGDALIASERTIVPAGGAIVRGDAILEHALGHNGWETVDGCAWVQGFHALARNRSRVRNDCAGAHAPAPPAVQTGGRSRPQHTSSDPFDSRSKRISASPGPRASERTSGQGSSRRCLRAGALRRGHRPRAAPRRAGSARPKPLLAA